MASPAAVPADRKLLALGNDRSEVWALGDTSVTTDTAVCKWKILDYNNCPRETVVVRSPNFWHTYSTEWCMILSKRSSDWFICFELLSSKRDEMVKAKLKASLVATGGRKYPVYTSDSVLKAPMKTVSKCITNLIYLDRCFKTVLDLQGEVIITSISSDLFRDLPLPRSQRSLGSDLASLLESGDLSDVVLCAGDEQLQAHRLVLSARSPVFAAMFRHDCLEAHTGRVDVLDVEPVVLREVLRYIYTDSAPCLEQMAEKLLVAADKYDLPLLKDLCESQLARNISVDRAASMALLAWYHSCNVLKRLTIRFIKRHLVSVMDSAGWANAVRNHPEVIVEITHLIGRRVEEH